MPIPIFSGQVGSSVAPLTPPVESLDTTAFARGAATAERIPSTASAIARGIEGGVENYQRGRLNEQKIQANQMELDQAAALQPEQMAAEQEALAEKRAQLADAVKTRQQRDELAQIIGGDDPQAKVQAVASGKFADILSKDKNLQDYVIKVVAPDMPEEMAAAWIKQDIDKQFRGMLMRNQQSLRNGADKAEAGLLESEEVKAILARRGNEKYGDNPIAIKERATWVPQGTFVTNTDGTTKRDPNTGYPIQKKVVFDSTQKPTYQIVDKETKQVIAENVSEKTKSLFEDYGAAQVRLQKGGLARPETREIIKQARKENESISGRKPTGPAAPSAPVTPVPKVSRTSKEAPLESAERALEKMPLVSDSGELTIKDNLALPVLFARSLGLDPERANLVGAEFAEISKILHEEVEELVLPSKLKKTDEERRQGQVRSAEVKDGFLRMVLHEEFAQNQEVLKDKYNDEAVRAHNDAYERWVAYQQHPEIGESFGGGDLLPNKWQQRSTVQSLSINDARLIGGVYKKVTSPEELFIESSLETRGSRLDAFYDRAQKISQGKLRSKANSAGTRTAIVDHLKVYK